MAIVTVKVFPPIGVARLGNSPTDFFVGPEVPGIPAPPAGGYKDAQCRVKRQAARFRLFGFDASGVLEQEITAADGDISWEVHLANTKGSWRRFDGPSRTRPGRNGVTSIGNSPPHEIDPGPRTLVGPNQIADFDNGSFLGANVPLGEARTDAQGRLLVLGGFGNSATPTGDPIVNYANNDGWYDDVSDGPVRASVVIDGTTFVAEPSWVLCAPPDFAPAVKNLTTLYDVLLQRAVDDGLSGVTVPTQPSFTRDIAPIIRRVVDLKRVNTETNSAHFNFDPPPTSTAARSAILSRLRNPSNLTASASANMPFLWDDTHTRNATVTKTQYNTLQKWTGTPGTDWIDDSASPPPAPTDITPQGMTKAALEACVGVAMYPGIEASWMLRDDFAFTEAFRLNHAGRSAGDVTKQMAVPWQADFNDCHSYGSPTPYAWWPAARPDDVFPEAGGGVQAWDREIVSSRQDMVAEWHKLGFVIDKAGDLVETERRKECKSLDLVTDRSHFSKDEVAGTLEDAIPALFENSLYVVARGFLPSELGVTAGATPEAVAPPITFTRSNGSIVPGMLARATGVLLQSPALPAFVRQRVTFVYRIEFANDDSFSIAGVPTDQVLTAVASKSGFSSAGEIRLLHQANPYMLDGATHWLSTDLRVFQLEEGSTMNGQTIGNNAAAAVSFIQNLVGSFNVSVAGPHPFEAIATDQQASKLELAESVDGNRVFNFAVARVRYRGDTLPANDVRVMFRMFTTGVTGLDYDQATTYRRSPVPADEISLLGIHNGEVVSIPCYGDTRVDTTTVELVMQPDSLNKQSIPAGSGEVTAYFGCWLDFNQTTARFPLRPTPVDGPWPTGAISIQEHIRGHHQCLVAELRFANDPIPPSATPGSNDNLSQRNLVISESANPGVEATRTVQHTFDIKATRPKQLVRTVSTPGVEFSERTELVAAGRDELLIRWNDIPREAIMTIYLPGIDVDEVLRYAQQNYEWVGIERVDNHTIRCLPADVTFLPLPERLQTNAAGLLTIELPKGVKSGQLFEASIHQISAGAIIGAFQFTIPVRGMSTLLPLEVRKLSVMRHIQKAIPADDRWRPVIDRYLGQIADRVDGFGGNSDLVDPSPSGSGRDEHERRCTRLGWIAALALAALIAMLGWHPSASYVGEAITAAILVGTAWVWFTRCTPDRCARIGFSLIGSAAGMAVLGVIWLFGAADDRGPEVLTTVAVLAALLWVLALNRRCQLPRLP